MAIYHLSVSNISRSQGRSVVAAAAYRSGERLTDERSGKVQDYSRRKEVVYIEIMTPEIAPAWIKDRSVLWNHIEALEKRKDARLAREVQFSLPRELSIEQNIALTRAFVQNTFVDHGMVADVAIHDHVSGDGESQPHAHVLLVTRTVSEAGFGLKDPAWNKTELLCGWREAWQGIANTHLAQAGHHVQIDHRSLAAQEIELEPQHKIGAVAAQRRLTRLTDHQRIARENGERLAADPRIALHALTRQYSTFTEVELAQFVNRHSDSTEQFQQVMTRVQACAELVAVGMDKHGVERFSTKTMLAVENTLMEQTQALQQRTQHGVRTADLEVAIFARALSTEQQQALEFVTRAGDIKCLVGYAGTGKSYLLGAAKDVWERSGYRVRGVALSGIAAQNMEQGSGITSRTVASQLYRWGQDNDHLSAQDILVIDEAGMLGSRQMARLIEEAYRQKAKVVLVGDPQQLQAIEAGAAFRAIAEQQGYLSLTDIRRQQEPWQRQATIALAQGQVVGALDSYRQADHVHSALYATDAKDQLLQQWHDVRHTNPEQTQIILTYTRYEVKDLNLRARALLQADGELREEQTFMTDRGPLALAPGDRVYFLKRSDHLHVVNGTLGTVQAVDGENGLLTVELDRDDLAPAQRTVTVDVEHYPYLDYGYAATVHKAQGITVDRTYLLASQYDDAHSTYVGMSRHRLSCDLFVSREVFATDEALTHTLSRERRKDISCDYPADASIVDIVQYGSARMKAPLLAHGQKLVDEERERQRQADRQELRDFVKAFDAANPEIAAQHAEFLMTDQDKQHRALRKLTDSYQQQRERRTLTDEHQQQFERAAVKLTQDKTLMWHLPQELSRTLNELAQAYGQRQHLERLKKEQEKQQQQRERTHAPSRGMSR